MTDKPTYEFGPFRLDPAEYVLLRDGHVVPLMPKAFETLLVLVENSGHIVDKAELYRQVWQDAFVEETNLTKNISILRKVLSEGDPGTPFIETVPKRGYRFIAPVREFRSESNGNGSTPALPLVAAGQETPAMQPGPDAQSVLAGIRQRKVGAIVALVVLVSVVVGFSIYLRMPNRGLAIGSVAVMPFVNDSGNPDNDYLADGMTETLINGLSQIPGLSVKGRSSVFRYKGKELSPPAIGKELGVQAILSGRLVERGNQITLNVELIDATTENVLWGNRYERKFPDLIKLQADVGRDVATRLGTGEAKVTRSYTTNPEAYELYLKGRYFNNKRTADSIQKALEAFSQAVTLDPNFALAYAGLADAHGYSNVPATESMPKLAEYVRKALELDDSLAAAHRTIANYKFFYERDFTGAKREFERAIELDPGDSLTYWDYSQVLAYVGHAEESIAFARRAKVLAPLDGSSGLAQAFVLAGRYDEALEETRATLELDEEYIWSYYWSGVAYSEKQMHDEAIAALEAGVKINGSSMMQGALANALARAGRRAEARRVLDELDLASRSRSVSETDVAMGYAGLGDKDQAFARLDRAFETRDSGLMFLKEHPMLGTLRDDPRFKVLLEKLNFPE